MRDTATEIRGEGGAVLKTNYTRVGNRAFKRVLTVDSAIARSSRTILTPTKSSDTTILPATHNSNPTKDPVLTLTLTQPTEEGALRNTCSWFSNIQLQYHITEMYHKHPTEPTQTQGVPKRKPESNKAIQRLNAFGGGCIGNARSIVVLMLMLRLMLMSIPKP